MKAIINGKAYSTKTAKRLCSCDNGRGRNDPYFQEVSLFKTRNGEYFLHGCGGAATVWGFEDKGWGRSFGAKIYPIAEGVGDLFEDYCSKGQGVRFSRSYRGYCHVGDIDIRGVEICLDGEHFSAPAAEKCGCKVR